MAENAEYMIMGYAAMLLILSGMAFSIYWRFRSLRQDEQKIERFLLEDQHDPVAASVGATASDAQPDAATPEVSGMAGPTADRSRSVPEA